MGEGVYERTGGGVDDRGAPGVSAGGGDEGAFEEFVFGFEGVVGFSGGGEEGEDEMRRGAAAEGLDGVYSWTVYWF